MNPISNAAIEYSLLILLEEATIGFAAYVNRLHRTFTQRNASFEIIILVNGTERFFSGEISLITPACNNIKAYVFNRKTTQAACLKAGLKESRGQIIVACGAYQQITEESFLRLIDSLDDDIDIVCPWRQKRVDPKINQVQSQLFNLLAKFLLDTSLNDLSCNVRVFKRYVLEEVSLYGNMYRFLPILAEKRGFKHVEIKCEHYEERGDTGIYHISEYVARLIDILTIYFNTKFIRKPLRFFMSIGAISIGSSLLIGGHITFQRLFLGVPVGNRPILLLSVFLLSLGVQITGVGLLGEIVSFALGRQRNEYKISQTKNIDLD
jgi:hypothetical protein